MTCNSDLNSRDDCIYLTRSDRGYQTAHSSDKIVDDRSFGSVAYFIIRLQKPQFLTLFKRDVVNDLQ